jgi:hypothetical protein
MDVWLYRGPDRLRALTIEPLGGNLPDDLGPWALVRPFTLHAGAPDEREAIELVEAHGYCCFE